jgi:hypothetical protein
MRTHAHAPDPSTLSARCVPHAEGQGRHAAQDQPLGLSELLDQRGNGLDHGVPTAATLLSAPAVRAPSRVGVCCGALVDHCPIAAYERAPATTAEAATSSAATNG